MRAIRASSQVLPLTTITPQPRRSSYRRRSQRRPDVLQPRQDLRIDIFVPPVPIVGFDQRWAHRYGVRVHHLVSMVRQLRGSASRNFVAPLRDERVPPANVNAPPPHTNSEPKHSCEED